MLPLHHSPKIRVCFVKVTGFEPVFCVFQKHRITKLSHTLTKHTRWMIGSGMMRELASNQQPSDPDSDDLPIDLSLITPLPYTSQRHPSTGRRYFALSTMSKIRTFAHVKCEIVLPPASPVPKHWRGQDGGQGWSRTTYARLFRPTLYR